MHRIRRGASSALVDKNITEEVSMSSVLNYLVGPVVAGRSRLSGVERTVVGPHAVENQVLGALGTGLKQRKKTR